MEQEHQSNMNQQSNFSTYTPSHLSSDSKKTNSSSKILFIIVIVALLIGGFGFRAYKKSQEAKEEEAKQEIIQTPTEEPTEEPEESKTPTASPSPTKKLSPTAIPTTGEVSKAQDLNVQVLNGSGEEGAAGKVATTLKNKGYKTVETGNADNFDYQKLTIKIKSSREKFLSTIKSDLSEYSISSESGTLSADSLFDVQIIAGKQ